MLLSRFFPTFRHPVDGRPALPAWGPPGDLGIALGWVLGALIGAAVLAATSIRSPARTAGPDSSSPRCGWAWSTCAATPCCSCCWPGLAEAVFVLAAKPPPGADAHPRGHRERRDRPSAVPGFPTCTPEPWLHRDRITGRAGGMFVVADATATTDDCASPPRVAAVAVAARLERGAGRRRVGDRHRHDCRHRNGFSGNGRPTPQPTRPGRHLIEFIISPAVRPGRRGLHRLLVPFLDLGITEIPCFASAPWGARMPGYEWTKVLFDTGLTAHFDQLASAGRAGMAGQAGRRGGSCSGGPRRPPRIREDRSHRSAPARPLDASAPGRADDQAVDAGASPRRRRTGTGCRCAAAGLLHRHADGAFAADSAAITPHPLRVPTDSAMSNSAASGAP